MHNHYSRIRLYILLLVGSISILLLPISSYAWPGYKYIYKEQIYELYHEQLYMYPENFAENIYWLEQALRLDFANPLNALAKITTEQEWEWYKSMFLLHINILLTRNYLQWGKRYYKYNAYFFNEPWKEVNIESMKKAKTLIEYSQVYWSRVLTIADEITSMKLYFLNLEDIQHWEDEYFRIVNNDLNYEHIISRELERISTLTKKFETMDENTY